MGKIYLCLTLFSLLGWGGDCVSVCVCVGGGVDDEVVYNNKSLHIQMLTGR